MSYKGPILPKIRQLNITVMINSKVGVNCKLLTGKLITIYYSIKKQINLLNEVNSIKWPIQTHTEMIKIKAERSISI